MPCNSDYMRATPAEELSKQLMSFLVEVGLLDCEIGCYGEPSNIDAHTQMLCQFCQHNDVSQYSLELQIWWRDHMKADKARLQQERDAAKTNQQKRDAMVKLTPYERELLGL